ncbi:MAG: alternative ribosome rescue aminoacyl-tRNA hydrolase ArfB [Ignavibacteria bacterium]|nr:alternative ribosome rescue aminoacyl-tRNA hydrolase ArfB [Ignavibacteria bacterium]
MNIITDNLLKEAQFKAVRSGGKGGQNVNKVSTKVELYFNIPESEFLSDEQKTTILSKLKNNIDGEGVLRLSSQTERSQIMNKNIAKEKFIALIVSALKKPKKRLKTNPTSASKTTRLNVKKIISVKKTMRRKDIGFDE